MPLKRRTAKQRDHRITPDAVAAFRAVDWLALHRALGLKPWEMSPLDVSGECPYPPGSGGGESWPMALALRDELQAKLGQ